MLLRDTINILLSRLNRLVPDHFIMSRMYIITTSWKDNQRKSTVASTNGAGWSEPLSRRFKGWNPLRKYIGSKEHLDWLEIDLNTAEIRTVRDYIDTKI